MQLKKEQGHGKVTHLSKQSCRQNTYAHVLPKPRTMGTNWETCNRNVTKSKPVLSYSVTRKMPDQIKIWGATYALGSDSWNELPRRFRGLLGGASCAVFAKLPLAHLSGVPNTARQNPKAYFPTTDNIRRTRIYGGRKAKRALFYSM